MKKLILLTSLSLMCLILTGCLTSENTDNSTAVNSASSADNKNATAPAPEVSKSDEETASSGGGASSPMEAFKVFTDGLKAKDPAKVKSVLSKNSMTMLEDAAKEQNQTIDEFISSGKASMGLSIGTDTRNEKIEGDTASFELRLPGTQKWETMHFVKEDGGWKVALDKG